MRVGYELANNSLISNKREWNNCFIENAHKIWRILPIFICKSNRFVSKRLLKKQQQQKPKQIQTTTKENKNQPIFSLFLILSIDTDGSYTMMAKPIRALELYYPMV